MNTRRPGDADLDEPITSDADPADLTGPDADTEPGHREATDAADRDADRPGDTDAEDPHAAYDDEDWGDEDGHDEHGDDDDEHGDGHDEHGDDEDGDDEDGHPVELPDGRPIVEVWPDPSSTPAPTGELDIIGRLVTSSNATFLAKDEADVRWVYKPVRGEAPLWDFPTGTLGQREIAAHDLSRAAGFHVVPPTVACEGPFGPGSAQLWVDDARDDLVELVLADEVPEGWFGIVVGSDGEDHDVALVHPALPALRRLALFDLVVNNADRKGGHVLDRSLTAAAPAGVLGVDHGLTFHTEPKLRTVLWGWSGEPFDSQERELLTAAREQAPRILAPWLSDPEIDACVARIDGALAAGRFPEPRGERPLIPWPPL